MKPSGFTRTARCSTTPNLSRRATRPVSTFADRRNSVPFRLEFVAADIGPRRSQAFIPTIRRPMTTRVEGRKRRVPDNTLQCGWTRSRCSETTAAETGRRSTEDLHVPTPCRSPAEPLLRACQPGRVSGPADECPTLGPAWHRAPEAAPEGVHPARRQLPSGVRRR